MSDDIRRSNQADPAVTHALRALLAPPAHDGYWAELESRVMSRIAILGHETSPWGVLATWMRPALVAAAAAVLMAAGAVLHARDAEARVAYESLLAPSPAAAAPVETALRPALMGERDVTLGFVIGH